jgi:hypothetical protein
MVGVLRGKIFQVVFTAASKCNPVFYRARNIIAETHQPLFVAATNSVAEFANKGKRKANFN